MEARMKKLTLALLACIGLSSCVAVVPVGRYERETYVSPSATYYPTYEHRTYRSY
jgi:hypothetical protein